VPLECLQFQPTQLLNADKTELLWAGSSPSLGDCGPAVQIRVDTVVSSNDVPVLGVTMSSYVTMDKHVSLMFACMAGFLSVPTTAPRHRCLVPLSSLSNQTSDALVHMKYQSGNQTSVNGR